MQAKASALIEILRDALRRVEEDSKLRADDPAVLELKDSILRGIAGLELLIAECDHRQAA
jgi:hypothetical protein